MIEYTLSLPEPHSHLFEVEIRVRSAAAELDLVMPSWTPGSYLMREFPRNVQDFRAHDSAGLPLGWRKLDKNTWRVDRAAVAGPVTVRYRVYANELTVRTSHLDASHGYVNGASVFMYLRSAEDEEARVRIETPEGWRIATALSEDEADLFLAAGYDELVDSPIEIGRHETLAWDQEGRPHRYAIWGAEGLGLEEDRLIGDTRRIIDVCSRMFGGLPYDEYLFILHVVPGGRGGLEHRSSCSVQVAPSWLTGNDYEHLIALVAHEFFHVWLGKRIRPEPLGPFDYTTENYTRNLWVVEGFTTYYTDLILRRAGLITRERYLERLGESIARLQAVPGRRHQSLEDASFDAWIKFYRPDAHTPNAQVSYYHKGSLVALALDLEIRRASGGERSLDDVMRLLWSRYGEHDVGWPEDREAGIGSLVDEVGGPSVAALMERYVAGVDEIDFDAHLEVVGLELTAEKPATASGKTPAPPIHEIQWGVRLREEPGGRLKITHTLGGQPAHEAGVNAGDELVAVAGRRATVAELARLIESSSEGDRIELVVMRRERTLTLVLEHGRAAERRPHLVVGESSPDQEAMLGGWLAEASGQKVPTT